MSNRTYLQAASMVTLAFGLCDWLTVDSGTLPWAVQLSVTLAVGAMVIDAIKESK